MGLWVLDRFDQLIDDSVGCGLIGIAHAEIDHIAAGRPRVRLHLIDLAEHIWRQSANAMKLRLAHKW